MRPEILVVDDEDIVRRSCRVVLEAAGWQVLEAGSAAGALALLASASPRLLLVDLKMPVMDGIQLMHRMRAMGLHIPTVVMSGYSTDDTAREAERMGALAFVSKPFTPDELSATIQSVSTRILKEGEHGQSEDPGH